MLKIKITNRNKGIDVKTLEITEVQHQKDISPYEVKDGDYNIYSELTDKEVYKFWVKDLYSIQEDSHLTSISNVMIKNDRNGTTNVYKYINDFIVDSVFKADNCLSFGVDKEILLNATHLYVETRYNAIMFIDNQWKIFKVDYDWINENNVKDDNKIKTSQAAYGKNEIGSTDGDALINDYNVFYYENDEWKTINLVGDKLEGCLNDGKIDFSSFHEYDDKKRDASPLEKGNIYYTCEDYIIIDFAPTHYFNEPYTKYSLIDDGVMERYKINDYGKEVIEEILYPTIYFYMDVIEKDNPIPHKIKIEKECHVENDSRIVFNFDCEKGGVFYDNAKIVRIIEIEPKSIIDGGVKRKVVKDYIKDYNKDIFKTIKDKLFPYGIEINSLNDEKPIQEGMLGGVEIKRDNFIFDKRYSTYSLIYDTAVNVVQIPISQKFENDLHHNDMIKEHFVEKTKRQMVNPIIDMEKDVYTPAIQEKVGEQINAKYIDCQRIIFNLHFREHRDVTKEGNKEEWQCDKNSNWNGTRVIEKEVNGVPKKVIDLKGRVYNYSLETADTTKKDKYDYFSYYGNVPSDEFYDKEEDYALDGNYLGKRNKRVKFTEYQSDLLSYLGFNNNDVKYQKSKLKKSFLRISFYDSDNIANQNLLHTSTIFLDSGNLFAKYIKNIETENEYRARETFTVETKVNGEWKETNPPIKYIKNDILSTTEYDVLSPDQQKLCEINGEPLAVTGSSFLDEDSYTVYDKIGVRVNREPMRNDAIKEGSFITNIDGIERLRLSSQFEVTDKFSSKRSSEGFYFYTYKSNDNGVFPNDIYMRVEFNHAGYGRTIPFMMPYIRKNEENIESGKPGYRYNKEKRSDKIKTFDDICYDWSELDIDNNLSQKDENDIGYGTVRYMKYCHIKWKYRYDKRTQKHIYYLDPDVYGDSVTYKGEGKRHGNNIILNLYEGKIR